MIQLQLVKIPPRPAPASSLDEGEHQRALDGLPHYWRLPWPNVDKVTLPCGHEATVLVRQLQDPQASIRCPFLAYGSCDGEPKV